MNTRQEYNRTTKKFDTKPIDFKIGKNEKVIWRCGNTTSNYTFSNPKRMGHLTKNFLRYIIKCQSNNVKPTKRGFYKFINKPLSNGNCSTFFRSIVESGIVSKHSEWNDNYTEVWYSIGINFHHYLNGNLDRYWYGSDGDWDLMTRYMGQRTN